jgi:hypothetical protein
MSYEPRAASKLVRSKLVARSRRKGKKRLPPGKNRELITES